MTHITRPSLSRFRSTGLLLAATLAGVLVVTPAAAHTRRDHVHRRAVYGHHQQDHGHVHRGYVNPYTPARRLHFEVPRLMRSAYDRYRPYSRGRSYYDPHRHHHTVYVFPVRTDGGMAYLPHHYCGGELFHASARYGGPSVSAKLGF